MHDKHDELLACRGCRACTTNWRRWSGLPVNVKLKAPSTSGPLPNLNESPAYTRWALGFRSEPMPQGKFRSTTATRTIEWRIAVHAGSGSLKPAPRSRASLRPGHRQAPDSFRNPCGLFRVQDVLDSGGAVPMRTACTRTPTVGLQCKLAVFLKIICSLFVSSLLLLVVILAPPIQAALHFMFQAMRNTKRVPATVPNTPATVASSR